MSWLAEVVHPGCVGGMKGLESLMASWDAQADLAEAAASSTPFVMAFLDYYNFFDSFHPAFFGRFLSRAGIHEDFLKLFVHLNECSQRYVKIADTYSDPIRPFNALGQGDPWVLIVAILYVSSQFRMVQCLHPGVSGSAVIDDRTLKGPPEQVKAALESIFSYDAKAGHITHPEKITLTAATQKVSKDSEQWSFDGFRPPVVQTQRLVGDIVTNIAKGASQLATSRLEFALRTMARIRAAETSSQAKTWAAQAMAIPRMVPSTLWSKPLESKLKVLRTAVIGTVLSRKRSQRCPEVVVSVCLNPARADPKSVLLYRTLLDARRLLKKSPTRARTFFMHLKNAARRQAQGGKLHCGPVNGVVDAVMELFDSAPIKNGDLELTPTVGTPCWLLNSTDDEFKEFMVRSARQSIWNGLSVEMAGKEPRRKDMKGFQPLVNLQASLVGSKPPKSQSCAIPAQLWKQLHLTVITGATVAGDKLHAMGRIETDICPLDDCRHTAEHLFWECSAFAALRRPFTEQIGKIIGMAVNQGASVQLYISDVLADTTFCHLGLVPGDPLAPDFAKRQWTQFALKPPVDASLLIDEHNCPLSKIWAGRSYRVVFTDGSIKKPRHPWLAHGGWGIFTGSNSTSNDWGHLEGPPFSSYRAELRAIVEAFSRAAVPVWAVCDNKAVAEQTAILLAKTYALMSGTADHPDLDLHSPVDEPGHDPMWTGLADIVNRAPAKFFRVSWIPGHLLDKGKEGKLEDYLHGLS